MNRLPAPYVKNPTAVAIQEEKKSVAFHLESPKKRDSNASFKMNIFEQELMCGHSACVTIDKLVMKNVCNNLITVVDHVVAVSIAYTEH